MCCLVGVHDLAWLGPFVLFSEVFVQPIIITHTGTGTLLIKSYVCTINIHVHVPFLAQKLFGQNDSGDASHFSVVLV